MSGRRRALAIHPGALGDVLQAVPALRVLGAACEVSFAGQPRLGEILAGGGAVARALSFDALGLDALFTDEPMTQRLVDQLAGVDRVVSWFGSRDELYGRRLRGLVPASVVAPPTPDGQDGLPVWRHLLDTLRPEGPAAARPECGTGEPAGRWRAIRAPLDLPESWRERALLALDGLGVAPGQPFVLVHPGAGGTWKIVPPRVLAASLARGLVDSGMRVIVHQGPADRDSARALVDVLDRDAPRLIEPTLPLLAGVLAGAAGYLGGDSGVSHLAAAMGAPSVILLPAATRRQWAPWSPTARVVEWDGDDAAVEAGDVLRAVVTGR